MLVRPEKTVTALVTTLAYEPARVSVLLPEKSDRFRLLVKSYDFTWNRHAARWLRNIYPERNGTALDRAAEIGRVLLAAGYSIDFPDEICRDLAISGEYQEEQTRWISAIISGGYAGWFFIRWSRREDFYRQARRLSGSRYEPPGVAIPPDSYEEVEDFSEVHAFSFTSGALEIIQKARARVKDALVVNIPLTPKPQEGKKKGFYEIADELRDEPF